MNASLADRLPICEKDPISSKMKERHRSFFIPLEYENCLINLFSVPPNLRLNCMYSMANRSLYRHTPNWFAAPLA